MKTIPSPRSSKGQLITVLTVIVLLVLISLWVNGQWRFYCNSESAHLISFKGAYHGWGLDYSYGHQFNPKTGKWDINRLHRPILYYSDLRGTLYDDRMLDRILAPSVPTNTGQLHVPATTTTPTTLTNTLTLTNALTSWTWNVSSNGIVCVADMALWSSTADDRKITVIPAVTEKNKQTDWFGKQVVIKAISGPVAEESQVWR